jgi:outer membrane protein assembly factor BamB
VALSRKFIWVLVDRDKSPELVKKYNLSAYPSLITINEKQEKIHRFSGFKKPPDFKAELEDALKRHQLYKDGKEWDTPAPRAAAICDGAAIASFKAPATAVPSGFASLGGDLWLGQGGKLYKLDPKTGEVKGTFDLPESTMDLCTDGKVLYAVPSSWTAGAPIREIDPATGKAGREIVTEANRKNKHSGANGIEFVDGKLVVLEGMRGTLHVVDPASGEIASTVATRETWIGGLAYDGTNYVAGGRTHLAWISPKGETVKKVAVNYPVRSVGVADGVLLLMEQPVFGYDKEHKSIQLWPRETNVYRLTFDK